MPGRQAAGRQEAKSPCPGSGHKGRDGQGSSEEVGRYPGRSDEDLGSEGREHVEAKVDKQMLREKPSPSLVTAVCRGLQERVPLHRQV